MKLIGKQDVIRPGNRAELHYWAGKLGVSIRQLNEAIGATGSFNLTELKSHLRSKGRVLGWLSNLGRGGCACPAE